MLNIKKKKKKKMTILLHPCKSFGFPNSLLTLNNFNIVHNRLQSSTFSSIPKRSVSKPSPFSPFSSSGSSSSFNFASNLPTLGSTLSTFCSRNEAFDGFSSAHLSYKSEEDGIVENEELGLLNKPSPLPFENGSVSEVDSEELDKDKALEPFLKFFKPRDSVEDVEEEKEESELEIPEGKSDMDDKNEEAKKVHVEYYEPKPGDFVVGVVVSGNENKLDVNVGADLLGTMLTKEVLPLYGKELEFILCDMNKNAEEFLVPGKMGIVKNDEALTGVPLPGRPVVETGTVLFAEVLGRTLSGRPLLSTRRLFRRIAWHRVRQVLF